MATHAHFNRSLVALLLGLACMLFSQFAAAQWWRFGADAGEPVFTDLLFNQVNALRVERSLQFSPGDLDGGKVIVRGRAEVAQGAIGRVEASLDDGLSWVEVPFSDRGMFAFEFAPQFEQPYRFKLRALSTTGQASNDSEHAFEFRLVRDDSRALAEAAFEQLLERYMARDRAGFMAMVSRDFIGNETALDSALSNDFRFFDAIRIRPTVQRMAAADDRWTIYFLFNRQVRSVRTGQLLQDQANTSVTLVREGDGYKLHELAAPLIFGVSDPGNLASFVTDESIGTDVLVLDRDGNVVTQPQGQATEGTPSNVRTGSFALNPGFGYSFLSRQVLAHSSTTAFEFDGSDSLSNFGGETEGGQTLSGVTSLDAVTSVPADMPEWWGDTTAVIGRVYALKLVDGTYVIFRIAGGSLSTGPITIEYRHQLNGTPNFR